MIELGVNIDHVATVRQARRAAVPDPVQAAMLAELGGAGGITGGVYSTAGSAPTLSGNTTSGGTAGSGGAGGASAGGSQAPGTPGADGTVQTEASCAAAAAC